MSTIAEREAAANLAVINRLQRERDALLKVAEHARRHLKRKRQLTSRNEEDVVIYGVIDSLNKVIALVESKQGGKLPYAKPRIIEEFFPTVAA